MVEDGKPEAPDIDVEKERDAERQDDEEDDGRMAEALFHRLEYGETVSFLSSGAAGTSDDIPQGLPFYPDMGQTRSTGLQVPAADGHKLLAFELDRLSDASI
jgi:hypothetical protein